MPRLCPGCGAELALVAEWEERCAPCFEKLPRCACGALASECWCEWEEQFNNAADYFEADHEEGQVMP